MTHQTEETARRLTSTRSLDALTLARALPRRRAREPGRRRARVDARDGARPARARQGRRSCTSSGDAPLPAEFGFMPLEEVLREPPADVGGARAARGRLRERAPDRPGPGDARRTPSSSSTSTTTTTTRASARRTSIVADASSTAEIVRDLLWRARRAADARDRRGALRRARHRHGPLPVLEHDAEGAPARGRAGRGRRRRARHLPQRLRDGAVREAEAARARARPCAALRGRAARRLVPRCAATSSEVGAEEPYSEGIIDYLRQAEGAQMVALIREPPERRAGRRAAISLRSSQDEVDVSAVARKVGRRRPPPGGRLLERGVDRGDRRVHPARVRRRDRRHGQLPMPPRATRPVGIALARQAGRPVVVRARRRAAPPHRRAHRPHRHARPVRDRAARAVVRRGDEARALLRRARQALRHRDRPDRDDARPAIRRARSSSGTRRSGRRARRAARRASAARSSCRSRPPRR